MFAQVAFKARKIEKRRLDLLKEKEDGVNKQQGKETVKTIRQKYRHYCIHLQLRCRRLVQFPKHSCPYRFCFNLKHYGTVENFVLKSIAGFVGGFILTYIFFMFFVLQLNFTLSTATIMCAFFGSILTIGLAFSFKVRCIVFLVLPQFFSKKGRQALLAYAYILAITGPAKNTLNNMSILGESLACGQEQLKAAVKQILEVVKKPFYAIRDAIKKVVETVKQIVAKIKEIMLSIKRTILSLVSIIKSAFTFIARLVSLGNYEFGTPYERCNRAFEEAILDCNAKLGPMFNWLCNIAYLVQHVCYIVKPLDLLFAIVDFITTTIKAIVTKVKQFVRHIRTMFYVRIKFSHSYHFESNHTKSMEEITTGIVTEIKQRSSGLIKIFDFMSSAASIFFLFMVIKVIYYRHKFLTNEMFDNKFITKDFRELDLRRAQMGIETVLPLNHRERKLYISTASLRLVKKEKSRLSTAAMILLMSTLKLSTHMATDYSLYWIMTKIRYYGRFQSKIDPPNMPGVYIEGEGFLASLLKGIVRAFQPLGVNLEIDTIPCLPDPIPPDYDRYIQIGSLLVICWFLAIFEPYGLRFRHSVMCYYHPQRARERAIWLYNHILRSRSSFLKFARRQLRRKVLSDKKIAKVNCMEFIRAKLLRYKVCAFLLGSGTQKYCMLCGEVYREGSTKVFIQCATPSCPGFYCEQCFNDLLNLCTVCLDPISYGDLSDISEEKDSSEDEIKRKQREETQRKLEKTSRKKRTEKRRQKRHAVDADDKALLPSDSSDTDLEGYTAPNERQLMKTEDKTGVDSDYNTADDENSSTSSVYDFEYQKHKDIGVKSEDVTPRTGRGDVEKQSIPNWATIQDFHASGVRVLMSPTFDDLLETSSSITPFRNASMQHLRHASPLRQTQAWLMNVSPRVKQRASGETDSADLISQSTAESYEGRYYTTPTSDYDEPCDGSFGDMLPLRRLNSKLSLEKEASVTTDPSPSSNQPSSRGYEQIYTSTSSSLWSSTNQDQTLITEEGQGDEGALIRDTPNNSPWVSPHSEITLEVTTYNDYNKEGTSVELQTMIEPLHISSSESSMQTSTSLDSSSASNPSVTCAKTSASSHDASNGHPDVPKLDLKFIDVEEVSSKDVGPTSDSCKCRTHSSSYPRNASACNCRLFKDTVKYRIENERQLDSGTTQPSTTDRLLSEDTGISEETHRSIQEVLGGREDGRLLTIAPAGQENLVTVEEFNVQAANRTTVISAGNASDTETTPSKRTYSKNTSEISVRRCSLDPSSSSSTYVMPEETASECATLSSSHCSVSDSATLLQYDSDHLHAAFATDPHIALPAGGSQTFVVQAEGPLAPVEGASTTQADLYKERIRNYYRHVNIKTMVETTPPCSTGSPKSVAPPPPATRRNPIKKLWRLLRR